MLIITVSYQSFLNRRNKSTYTKLFIEKCVYYEYKITLNHFADGNYIQNPKSHFIYKCFLINLSSSIQLVKILNTLSEDNITLIYLISEMLQPVDPKII